MPPSYAWKFSIKEFFWNTKVFSNEIFWYSQTKTFRRKIVIPLLSIKYFSLPEIFWNTEWFPGEVFSVLWENFRQNREDSPLLCLKLSDTRILSKQKGSSTNFIGTVRQKFFNGVSDIAFLSIKFCDTRNFLKHRSVPQRIFSVLCDTKFSAEKRDTPLSLMHKIFWYPNFSDTPKCSPTKFVGPVRQKNFERKVVIRQINGGIDVCRKLS